MERPDARSPGERIGPYALVRRLGAGGGGEVWEAVLHGPAGFRKPVALKLLREGPADEEGRDALLREARLGALLQHPNVVGTLQLGRHDGAWCIALELVRGLAVETLCRRLGAALPASVVLDIGIQAAAGLHHVHDFRADGVPAGLVHRDVKPANLLVDRSGVVKVADLGITLLRGESDGAAGTPGFMAPEQILGRPEPRSDLFSLGVVLYALSTDRRPFGRGAEHALHKARNVEALLADEAFLAPVDAAVPGLGAVVRRCLRHDPARRPGSARELADALAELVPRQAPGPSLVELLARLCPELEIDTTSTPSSDLATRVVPNGNLRVPRDAFVGREGELGEVEALVRAERWVAIVGPGGTGKTRLALQVARRLQHAWAGGAWAFDLTEARTEDEVAVAVAGALGLELDRRDPIGQIGRALAAKGRALVVLDNLEQCVDALPGTLGVWLDRASEVSFLGTTRIVPGLVGERTLALGELLPADAAALLRARAPRPLTERERPDVEPLCAALDHLPLPIELAAARLRVLDAGAIRARLSLSLLSGGGAERPERHRSVRASLQWSAELLSPGGRRALAQLSVFDGGCDLAGAEAVLDLGADAPWALDVLQELTEASLLQVDAASGRFRMRAVVREFAAELSTGEARREAEVRHGEHYAQLGAAEVTGPGAEGELDNLLAACRRAVARGDERVAVATLVAADRALSLGSPLALRVEVARAVAGMPSLSRTAAARVRRLLAVALHDLGRTGEAIPLAEGALAIHVEDGDLRSEALAASALGLLLRARGRPDEAAARYARALALHRQLGERRLEGEVLGNLGILHRQQGRVAEARAHYERALALHQAFGDRRAEGVVLRSLGALCSQQEQLDEARLHFEQALRAHQEVGDRRFEALTRSSLGTVALDRSRFDEARRHFECALASHRELGDRRGEGTTLGNLALVDSLQDRPDDAHRRFEQALEAHRDVGNRRSEGITLGNLGHLLFALGRDAEARACYDEALAIDREVGNRSSEGVVLGRLAAWCEAHGAPAEARDRIEHALRLHREVRNLVNEALLHALRSRLHRAGGRPDAAREDCERALALAEEAGDPRITGLTWIELAQVVAAREGLDAAAPMLDLAELTLRRIGARDTVAVALATRAELFHRAGRPADARRSLGEAWALAPWHAQVRRELTRIAGVLDA